MNEYLLQQILEQLQKISAQLTAIRAADRGTWTRPIAWRSFRRKDFECRVIQVMSKSG